MIHVRLLSANIILILQAIIVKRIHEDNYGRKKMKKLFITLLVIISLLFVSCINTEITLSGKVIDKTNGLPISNAKVSDGDYGKGNMAITDALGQFSYITYCEEHTIEITVEGYKSIKKTLTTPLIINKNEITIEIELEKE